MTLAGKNICEMCWLGQKALTQAISVALSEKKMVTQIIDFSVVSAHDDGRRGKESYYGAEWLYAEWQPS